MFRFPQHWKLIRSMHWISWTSSPTCKSAAWTGTRIKRIWHCLFLFCVNIYLARVIHNEKMQLHLCVEPEQCQSRRILKAVYSLCEREFPSERGCVRCKVCRNLKALLFYQRNCLIVLKVWVQKLTEPPLHGKPPNGQFLYWWVNLYLS